jgi:thiol:disulfide interchange protein DsbA
MKKTLFMLTALLASALFTTSALANTWQENTHYKIIKQQASPQAQVLEVFSFWCPACYRFEPIAQQIKSKLPRHVSFTKAHVNFLGGASKETQNAATAAMIAARAMQDENTFNTALFNAIHRDRTPVVNMNDIKGIYQKVGGDGTKLEKLSKSFGIKGQIKRNDTLTQGVRSVPTFIVNGKYQAIFTRDMTPDQFVELIIWLTSKQ